MRRSRASRRTTARRSAGLADHLYGLGHRRLAYLSGVARSASNAARLAALAEFRADHPDVELSELESGVDFDSGAAAADAVIATGATGVLAFNDLVAMGLLSALSDRGVRVPQDVSITGFDDIPFAAYTSPPLTTASVPAAELGTLAWRAMNAVLTGDEASGAVRLAPEVVLRGSTGPVAAEGSRGGRTVRSARSAASRTATSRQPSAWYSDERPGPHAERTSPAPAWYSEKTFPETLPHRRSP